VRTLYWMIGTMDPSLPKVRLELWRADAVVLFDWLMSVDLNAVPITHPAEKQALADLLAAGVSTRPNGPHIQMTP